MQRWNPDAYLAHEELHSQPIIDLLHRIDVDDPRTVVDLGCGPGNSTAFAATRWPNAAMTGVDLSEDMLAKAKAAHPGWRWILAGIEDFRPTERFDVVISCAALQWLKQHELVLPQLWRLVNERGALAVQMPSNQESPIHRAIFRTAQSNRWRPLTGDARSDLNFQPPEYYFPILSSFAGRVDLWETIYHHEMKSCDALLEWARGTVLRPFFARLPEESARAKFAADVMDACRDAYPTTNRGTIIYIQKRLFFIAYKKP
jgi:trans-aconitate 2-methyltransferase